MTTATTRIWTFASVIAVIVIVALGWFLGVSPKVAEITRFEAERLVVAAQNEVNRATLASLQADFENLDEFREQLDAIEAEFPELPEYAELLDLLRTAALPEGLALENLALGEPAAATIDSVLDEFGQLPQGTLIRLDGAIGVQGDVLAALRYVSSLQSAERFVLITDVVHSEGRNPDDRSTTITFSLFLISGEPVEGALQVSPTPDGPEEQAAEDEEAEG